MKNIWCFEGGPLDGAQMGFDADDLFLGDIIIALPARAATDADDVWTDLILHRYTCCNSSQIEGSPAHHYMGHVATGRASHPGVDSLFTAGPGSSSGGTW